MRLAFRAFEGDRDVEIGSGLLGPLLHGLPELVLEALGDDRNVRLGRGIALSRRGFCRRHRRHQQQPY
jgi:hypothetical protein